LAQANERRRLTNPLFIKSRTTTRTVFVERPIIRWDEVKSLTSDGTRGSFKDDYAAIIYVSEIHFADGTEWKGEIK